jgi:hypothetical protein
MISGIQTDGSFVTIEIMDGASFDTPRKYI